MVFIDHYEISDCSLETITNILLRIESVLNSASTIRYKWDTILCITKNQLTWLVHWDIQVSQRLINDYSSRQISIIPRIGSKDFHPSFSRPLFECVSSSVQIKSKFDLFFWNQMLTTSGKTRRRSLLVGDCSASKWTTLIASSTRPISA